jgi:hypothetical protein
MAWHHIIPKHEWKTRFGNLRGFNAPDNLVNLHTEQHAQVHLHYFNEITHIEYDRIAGLAISKQIGKEEANRQAVSATQMGNKNHLGHRHNSDTRELIRGSLIGKQNRLGKTGHKLSIETRVKMSVAHKGIKLTTEHRNKLSIAAFKRSQQKRA